MARRGDSSDPRISRASSSQDGDNVTCNICRKNLRNVSKNTTGMITHLKLHNLSSNKTATSVDTDAHSSNSARQTKYPEGSKRQQQLHEARVAMITDDFQTFSIVEDTGFRRFVSLEAYIAVTGHFINTNWNLKALVLETFPEKHTTLNISEALDNVISKWNIENKVVSITNDNASNMTAAVQLIHSGNIDMQHVPCLAHTINLVVKSSLNSNSELCIMREKARKIVSYFKTSCNANEKIHEIQDLMKKPVHKLIQETATRWNSTFYMLQRLVEQKECIAACLSTLY
ncbi:E3 SUMO-protein ligase ZBED1-like [Schistocerca gregaria]|uniref:E3 SUMO-protein ligase ZBED1-like n=1 Tax=Schistocerca gregaria TaxID=7010 RepID=UPI00211E2353|nr:E3 SUMO-protein ligase ZBED1-like [Schistocerca gregaria]